MPDDIFDSFSDLKEPYHRRDESSERIKRINALMNENNRERQENETARTSEYEIERLLMITEALWSFIKKEHGYEDKDLMAKVLEIDARDGNIDGRVAKAPPKNCPNCNRVIHKRRNTCSYCGTAVIKDVFER